MRKFIIILFLFLFATGIQAQTKLVETKKVPEYVQKRFLRKNSRAKEIKWFEDRENRQYTVKFKEMNTNCAVVIDYDGNILEKRTDVEYSKLPERIKTALKKDYKKLKFVSAQKIEKGKKDRYYKIIMHESRGRKKAPLVWEIQYDLQGKFLTVYEPDREIADEEVRKDRYDEMMDEDVSELKTKVRDEKVSKKELPTEILTYLKENYDAEYRPKEMLIKYNSKYGQYYYIVMKKQGEKKEFVHYFDMYGKLLKKREVDL